MPNLNPAQWFMLLQIVTCIGASIGYVYAGKPWGGSVWFFYGLANVGWLGIASGKA